MADEKTFTKSDLDTAIEKALAGVTAKNEEMAESITKLEAKNKELVGDVRKAQSEARAAKEISPDDFKAEVERADKAEAKAAELEKSIKTLTTERDKAVKSLETEQSAARNYALDAEINGAIAAGNIVPDLAAGLTAMMRGGAKVELIDGKYTPMIGDKPAREHIKEFLDSDAGKAWRLAPMSGGGGAPGGGKGVEPAKTIKQSELYAIPLKERNAKMAEGYELVPDE